uniref:Ig-like domain-containing protein n=1 Tax=Cyprinodon variegatus TaxID=28743 RepID=A0A3Q2CKE8_CYPVA
MTLSVPHQVPLKVVEVGENVTLHCPVSTKEGKFFYWYKQTPGYMLQTVATAALSHPKLSEQFNNSRFKLTKGDSQFSLTIRNITKEDEATYLCQNGTAYFQTFSTGMYLAVNGDKTQILVKQTPESTSVQEGDTVNLHCSLLTKTSINSLQCPSNYSVYWFKAGSGESYPSLIYTPKNSSDVQQRSCVYKLSKTIQNSSDTGIYYCAVITCEKILFGEGTKVQKNADEASYVALNFSAIKTKGKKRRMETQPECLYSAVRTGQPTRQGVS